MHLSITGHEWRRFMAVADETFTRIAVPVAARRELVEILSGFEQQCVLPQGAPPPPTPGAPRAHPSSVGTVFQRLGGVYPIAMFADRLVTALVADARAARPAVGVQFDALDAPDARRHAPGLAYLLTELLCAVAGGPEVVTCKGFDEAKLCVPAPCWAAFCALASDAAAVFPTAHHRGMILAIINECKPELCVGIDDSEATPAKKLEAAGFEAFDAVAALARTQGDLERALELLVSGWRPEVAAAEAAAAAAAAAAPKCPFGFGGSGTKAARGLNSLSDMFQGWVGVGNEAAPPKCPFSGGGATELPPGHPPVPTPAALPPPLAEAVRTMAERGGQSAEQIAAMMSLDLGAVQATLAPAPAAGGVAPLPPGLADAARTMAQRGIRAEQIAEMLKVDAAAVKATLEAPSADVADGKIKILGDPMQQRLDALLEEDPELCCPVTLVLLVDPVTAADQHVYERSAAEALTGADGRFVSPMTRESLPPSNKPNEPVRERTLAFRRERLAAMLAYAEEAAAVQPELAMGVVDRTSEYLTALPAEAVAMLAVPTMRACDALLKVAHTAEQPSGTWHAKPQQLRRVHALKLQVTAGGGADLRQLTCMVCFDEYASLKGLECSGPPPPAAAAPAGPFAFLLGGGGGDDAAAADGGKHFVCEDCLAGHVTSSVDAESIDLFRQRGGVRCVDPGCRSHPFTDAALAKALPADVFATYTKAKERVAEQRINAELEAGFEQRLKREREKAGEGAHRQAIKDHICEKILTLSCPRCHQAFVDFTGCMALSCSRAGCGCGFCALCQQDCGGDAHGHVGGGCPLAGQIGVKKGEFHLSEAAWNKAASKARAIRLREYLGTLTEAQRQHALEDCQRELADIGLKSVDFGLATDDGYGIMATATKVLRRSRR